MFPKLLVNVLNVKKNLYKFSWKVHKNYNGDSDTLYIFEVAVEYCKNLHVCMMIYRFYLKEWKLKYATSLFVICMIKITMLSK